MTRVAISLNVTDEVKALMAELKGTSLQTARAFNKGIGRDKKLNAFLAADFGKGVKLFIDKDARENVQDKIAEGIAGYTGIAKKQAMIARILQSEAHEAAQAEAYKLTKDLILTDEQKTAVAKKTAELEQYLLRNVYPGAEAWAKELLMVAEPKPAEVATRPELVEVAK